MLLALEILIWPGSHQVCCAKAVAWLRWRVLAVWGKFGSWRGPGRTILRLFLRRRPIALDTAKAIHTGTLQHRAIWLIGRCGQLGLVASKVPSMQASGAIQNGWWDRSSRVHRPTRRPGIGHMRQIWCLCWMVYDQGHSQDGRQDQSSWARRPMRRPGSGHISRIWCSRWLVRGQGHFSLNYPYAFKKYLPRVSKHQST